MFFVENDNFMTEGQKHFINTKMLDGNFPFYLMPWSVSKPNKDNNPYLTHIILNRPEERPEGEMFNSEYHKIMFSILESFCFKNDIKINELLRSTINLTFKVSDDKCIIHRDHDYDHKQLLVYLNDPIDTESKTVILDDDEKTILKEIKPKQFTGVCFENKPHYHYYPKQGYRIVAVYTFR